MLILRQKIFPILCPPFKNSTTRNAIELENAIWEILHYFLETPLSCAVIFFAWKHGLQTPNKAFFHPNSKRFGFGGQIGQISLGAFGLFSAELSAQIFSTLSPLIMFFINQPLFLQKTKPLLQHPKELFGIGIWIWAAKNKGFSLHVSVVRAWKERMKFEREKKYQPFLCTLGSVSVRCGALHLVATIHFCHQIRHSIRKQLNSLATLVWRIHLN